MEALRHSAARASRGLLLPLLVLAALTLSTAVANAGGAPAQDPRDPQPRERELRPGRHLRPVLPRRFRPQQAAVVRIDVKGMKRGTWISKARVYTQGIVDPNGGNNQVSMTVGVQKRR